MDLLIAPNVDNARRVLEAPGQVGYRFAREWLPEETLRKPVTIMGDDPAADIFPVAWSVRYEDAVARSTTPRTSKSWRRSGGSGCSRGVSPGSVAQPLSRHAGPWRGLEDVERATLEWWSRYNPQRLLEPLDYVPPRQVRGAVCPGPDDPSRGRGTQLAEPPRRLGAGTQRPTADGG